MVPIDPVDPVDAALRMIRRKAEEKEIELVLDTAQNPEAGQDFLEFVLSDEAQQRPGHHYANPINRKKLRACFALLVLRRHHHV